MSAPVRFKFAPVLEIQDVCKALRAMPELAQLENAHHRSLLTIVLQKSDVRSEEDLLADAQLLLEGGADPSAGAGKAAILPLEAALRRPHRQVVRLLLAHGADVNARNTAGQTAVFWAAQAAVRSDDLSVLTEVLDAEADVSVRDKAGQSVLDAVLVNIPRNRGSTRRTLERIARVLKARGATAADTECRPAEQCRRDLQRLREMFGS